MIIDEKVIWNVYDTYNLCAESIMDVFTENYGLFKLKVFTKYNNNPIIIEKYNVLGWNHVDDYFTLYEDASLNKKITEIKINEIKKIMKE